MSESTDRLRDVLELVAQAQELLDQAVGRGSRLTIRDRECVREYLMPPRNHLRSSVDSLRRKVDTAEAQAREKRGAR
jgi:hypothetical protein